MTSHKEVITDQRTHKLTKLWLALFFFTLVINAIPYIPFLNDDSLDQTQIVMQANHSAICSSAAFREESPRSNSSLLVEGLTGSVPGDVKVQDRFCTIPVSLAATLPLLIPDFFVPQPSPIPAKIFFADHPGRGPPHS